MNTRRQFVSHAAQTAFGLSVLPGFSSLANSQTKLNGPGFGSAKRIIFINVNGGMSQIDTFDPKEKSKIKGPGKTISSKGDFQMTDFLPQTAKIADQISIIRSMTAKVGVHRPAQYFMRTAFAQRNTIKHPNFGAWAHHYLGASHETLPSSACINQSARYGNGYFAPSLSPIPILSPESGLANIKSDSGPEGLKDKLDLAQKLSTGFVSKYKDRNVAAYREFYDHTLRMLRSEDLKAFDISKESNAMRERYGKNKFGQGCLLARRLVEAGIRFVEVASDGWDMHQDIQGDMTDVAPSFDQGYAALINDLKQRGMLDSTLVVLATEFGRKPEYSGAGRGHFPTCFTVGLAGAGIKRGFAYGASDESGRSPDNPVTVGDFHATIGWAAGLPLNEAFITSSGRSFHVGGDRAKPIAAMFA